MPLSSAQSAAFKTYAMNVARALGPDFKPSVRRTAADDLHDAGLTANIVYKSKVTVAGISLTRTRPGAGYEDDGRWMLEAGALGKDGLYPRNLPPAVDGQFKNQTKPPRKLLADIVDTHPEIFRRCAPVHKPTAERTGAMVFFIL